eukprot:CAMPEP_0174313198 /NCGR_PEP_ID=MMETSP0810-20121108/4819_1 /TAXON_ID=73025 ORGANISM="Eutreptiella gymnastica-like, Strain CCMP1594" /NCGR_SAMPLE_ID=MMETSP0810 /ASSEMBLY_ACC=CAM_ASM_000659 /LENGTH=93 /DNA_ID=CAMNT_0015421889 /DNA_START=1328 /DNA_END=1605 /DNA_ORIENTATION=-
MAHWQTQEGIRTNMSYTVDFCNHFCSFSQNFVTQTHEILRDLHLPWQLVVRHEEVTPPMACAATIGSTTEPCGPSDTTEQLAVDDSRGTTRSG